MYRTANCGQLNAEHEGETFLLSGWVNRARDMGGLVFVDLRDRYGLTQIVFEPDRQDIHELAGTLHMEFVIRVEGTVRRRPDKEINPRMATGEIELVAKSLEILSRSATLPFMIRDDEEITEEQRLKFRYLDIRRNVMQQNLITRHRMYQVVRNYLSAEDFVEVETPTLMKSTPEGARDYLVPSRVHPGHFYALPQSPQTYKQLLMVGGLDRYFQIVKCFRDEDLRSDRQPEFTQIDIEMSFVTEDDVLTTMEGLISTLYREIRGIELDTPFPRISWHEAMAKWGSDKPDLRFGMPLQNVSSVFFDSGFGVYDKILAEQGEIQGIVVPGVAGEYSRKKIDRLNDYVKHLGVPGLTVIKVTAEGPGSSIAKFVGEERLQQVVKTTHAAEEDLIVLAAGKPALVQKVLGHMRAWFAEKHGLINPEEQSIFWVVDFPMFDYSEEEDRWVATHHPFTQPYVEDLEKDPGEIRARAYDLVINGYEAGGGSIRIHDSQMQKKVFHLLGISDEEARMKFGFLLDAFEYGAPPHGGIAFGFDRLVMLLTGQENIKDVIAFPKTNNAASLMDDAPAGVSSKQLEELHICLDLPTKE